MMRNTYRFAMRNVEICSLYPDIHDLCREYRTKGAGDFLVETTREDISFEREKSLREEEREGISQREFEDGYLETLSVYRKIAEKMPSYDTVLFHGSCIATGGEAYLFTAKSGTGKSTHVRLWRELLGEEAEMVNDDKPLVRIMESGAVAYGTPWDGKHHLSKNIAVPLRAICILERAKENRIHSITPSEAMPMLLQQVYRPMDASAMGKTLSLIGRLAGCVKLCRLGATMDISAAELSYAFMKG